MRFLCAEIQNVPIKVRNTRDSSVNSSNVQNVKKSGQTQREILIINIDMSKKTHTQLRGAYFYSQTSVHELNSFLKVVRKPKCS